MHIINSFVGMPVSTEPRNVVCSFLNFVEPFFRTVIHRTLVDAGDEFFDRFILEWAGMRQHYIDGIVLELLFNIAFDFFAWLFICPPSVSSGEAIELVYAVSTAYNDVSQTFYIVYLSVFGK